MGLDGRVKLGKSILLVREFVVKDKTKGPALCQTSDAK